MLVSDKIINIYMIQFGLTEEEATKVYNIFIDEIAKELKLDSRISIQNFGVFEKDVKNKRLNRHPITGTVLKVVDNDIIKFRATDSLTNVI